MYVVKDVESADAIVVQAAGMGRDACVQKITSAVHVAEQFAGLESAAQKQWVIDQMLRELLGEDYAAWAALRKADISKVEWDTGLAP